MKRLKLDTLHNESPPALLADLAAISWIRCESSSPSLRSVDRAVMSEVLGSTQFFYINNTYWFGMLVGISAIGAFIADVTVVPALMMLLTGGRLAGPDQTIEEKEPVQSHASASPRAR